MKTSLLKEFIRYSSLNVLGMIGLSCYILADTFFVAKGLGTTGLAALNLAIPIYSFIHGTGLMLGIGGSTKYAIARSQQKNSAADRAFSNTVLLGLILALCFFSMGLTFSDKLTLLLGADEAVFAMSKTYLKMTLLFAPAFILNDILLCFIRNDGGPQLSMAAMLIGSMANIILDYIFIFPLNMGIFGAVLATGFAPIISITILSPFFFRKRNHFHFRRQPLAGRLVRDIFFSGLPSLVTEMSGGVVIIVFNMLILSLAGNTGVAAYGVIANLSLVVIAIYTGIAQGVQPIFSRQYGIGEKENVKILLKYSLIAVGIVSIAVYTTVFLFAEGIVGIFNSEGNGIMQGIAVDGMRLYFTACVFAGTNIILAIFFTSKEKPLPANIISLLRGFIVIIPMAFLLSQIGGLTGIWMVFPLSELIVCFVGLGFLMKEKKNSVSAVQNKDSEKKLSA